MTTSNNKYRFSLALLFYNEEENIIPVVTELRDALNADGINFQLVLVNNGSTDRTPILIKELVAGDRRLKEVTVEKNLGYGWGVINGLKGAEGKWIGYMDGDGQVEPADVVKLLQAAGSGRDLIKVRRALRQDGFIRAWVSNVYVMMVALLYDLPFYDINAKPRIFRRQWLKTLSLSSRDWFLDAEIMIKAGILGLSVKEIPIIFKRREEGSSKVRPLTVLEFLKNIMIYRIGRELRQWQKKIKSKS